MKTFVYSNMVWLALSLLAVSAQAQDYFPLERGTTWVYRSTGPYGAEDYAVKVWNVFPDGTRQLRTGTTYSYLRKTDAGIVSLGYTYKGGDLPDLLRKAETVMNLPVKLGDSWEYENLALVQVVVRPGEQPPDFRVKNVVTVGSDLEQVTVPAGTFQAIKIETTSEGEALGKIKKISYLADGVGLIKEVITAEYGTTTVELKKFTRGRDVSDREIRDAVARFAGVSPEKLMPLQDKDAYHMFRSRFFSFGKKLFRYTGGTVSGFDPLDPSHWKALSVEDRSLRGPMWIEIGKMVARLASVGSGFDFNRAQISFLNPASGAGANFKVTDVGKKPIIVSVKTNSDGTANVKVREYRQQR